MRITVKYVSFFLWLTWLLPACKTGQPARPEEFYNQPNLEPEPSVITIPIRLYRSELLKSLNDQIGDMLYEDASLADDGLMMRAKKRENITIDLDSQSIRYRVPVDLWVKKDVLVSYVEGEGSLALDFVTRYKIRPDWTLETATELKGYDWLKKPVVKLGFADLPVTTIANVVLNNVKKDFAKSIDREVKAAFDLRKQMEAAWKQINEPYLVSEEYKTWLTLHPQSIGMTPLRSDGSTVKGSVVVITKPEVVLGAKPQTAAAGALPPFQYANIPDENFHVYLNTQIPFSEAERLTRQNMVGQSYTYGKKTVTVEDVDLFGQGNKMVVNLKLTGSYNGNVYLTAKPVFNENKNKIELSDVDFDFSTQKLLMKSATWLFKGPIKNKVQENLDFYLNYNLEDSKKMLQSQLSGYQIAPGIALKGVLNELNVSHVYITPDAIRVRLGMEGKIDVEVKGLGY